MTKRESYVYIGIVFVLIFVFSIMSYAYSSSRKPAVGNFVKKEKVLTQGEKDQNGYADAVMSLDEKRCEAISEPGLKSTCKETVSDSIVFDKAIVSQNIETCKDLKNAIRKNDCEIAIASSTGMAIDSKNLRKK